VNDSIGREIQVRGGHAGIPFDPAVVPKRPPARLPHTSQTSVLITTSHGCDASKEKVKIEKHLPVDIAEETSVLRVSHISVDFQRIEMIRQVHHCCGEPNSVFGRDLNILRGSKVK